MGEKVYNKLVRDKIPQVIESGNQQAVIRIMDAAEFGAMLRVKLVEEANEAAHAADRAELVGELADLKEVVSTIQRAENISEEEIEEVRARKSESRGGVRGKNFP